MKKTIIFVAVLCSAIVTFSQVKNSITLKEAVLEQYTTLAPERIGGLQWLPSGKYFSYYSDTGDTLFRESIKTNNKGVVLTTKELNEQLKLELKRIPGIHWISDNEIIFSEQDNIIWRYDLNTKKGKRIAILQNEAENIDVHYKTGRSTFTSGKTLFVSRQGDPIVVAKRSHEELVCGQAIARFEFGISKGTFWSENGNFLAFYEKDEIEVSNYPLLDITTTPANLNTIKYPMAGQGSELAKVGVYELSSGRTVYLQTTGEKDQYLTNVSWSPDEKYVLVAVVNRDQNQMKLNQYEATTGKFLKTLFEEKNEKWVEPEHPAYFISNAEFIWLSERDGFMNLYHYGLDGNLKKQITTNKWVATGILGYDAKAMELYFTGTGENPTEMHAFKVNFKKGVQTKLTSESGVHHVQYGNGYLIDNYSNIETPRVIQILDTKGKKVKTLLKAADPLVSYQLSRPEIFTIKSADDKTELYCRMIKPSNFNPNRKYPVLVYVYGGPHAQMVTNSWLAGAPLWMYYQAERDYIIFTVDNRGSENRGFAFESAIHRNLGHAEIEDQMKGVEYLQNLPYVNKNRMAVHGWSYGGFMTTSLMLRKPGVFTTGVAGGPVTDWKYYEVMYGERYMDRPEQNEEGYEKARLHNYVQDLEGNILLIHGTVDDVVVMQHNLSLVKSFIDNEVQVDFFPYPMHPHNVRGKDRVHLMTKVLTYIEDNNGGIGNRSRIRPPKNKEEMIKKIQD